MLDEAVGTDYREFGKVRSGDLRRARSGRQQGRALRACSDHPDCRALLDIDD